MKIKVYTDGASRNHAQKGEHIKATDPAAYGFLIRRNGLKYEYVNGAFGTSNNCMELYAVFVALTYMAQQKWFNDDIEFIVDSKYISDAINQKWLKNWRQNGWKNTKKKPVANKDLWIQIDTLLHQFKKIKFTWVKGHAQNEGNNYVDKKLNDFMDNLKVKH